MEVPRAVATLGSWAMVPMEWDSRPSVWTRGERGCREGGGRWCNGARVTRGGETHFTVDYDRLGAVVDHILFFLDESSTRQLARRGRAEWDRACGPRTRGARVEQGPESSSPCLIGGVTVARDPGPCTGPLCGPAETRVVFGEAPWLLLLYLEQCHSHLYGLCASNQTRVTGDWSRGEGSLEGQARDVQRGD